MAHLQQHNSLSTRHELLGEQVTIGRAEGNDIVLENDVLVSRRHAALERREGQWSVRDLRSRNGTFVNGSPCGDAPLRDGDQLRIGSAIFDFELGHDPLATMADERAGASGQELPALSDRERELLALLATGMTDQQIAGQMCISPATVRSHLDRIRDKTGRRRRSELTRLAIEAGLVR